MQDAATAPASRTLLIWGVALIVALWLALTAAGAVFAELSPRIALALYPKNGFAYQSRAAEAVNSPSIRDLRISPDQLADAREALRREPLASTALTLIGIDRDLQGKHDEAVTIIAGAHAINKRQILANGWLIGRYGTQPGRTREVLGLLDEALRIDPGLAAQYMPAFAQALTNPDTIPVFQRLLAGKPGWEPQFWQAVSASDAALPNAEVLRARILAGPEEPGEIDDLLMAAFIRARRMDLALSYAKSLPDRPEDRDNLLRNSSFTATPRMPPLDWELINDGRIGAAVDEGRGTLQLDAIAGSVGTVARQLVALPPGNYVLLVKLAREEFARGSDLTIRIHCAEASDQTLPSLSEKVEGDVDRTFAIPADSKCRFFWVELVFSALDSTGPASTNVAEVKIVRAREQQTTEAPSAVTDGRAPE